MNASGSGPDPSRADLVDVATVAAFVFGVLIALLTGSVVVPILAAFSWLVAVVLLRRGQVNRRVSIALGAAAVASVVAVVVTAGGASEEDGSDATSAPSPSTTTSTVVGPGPEVVPGDRLRDEATGLEAAIGVANVTRGDEQYSPSVRATYDDVVKVQLWYGNYSPDATVFENLFASIIVPSTEPGLAEVAAVAGFGSTQLRPVARIELARPDARLSYIPGSLVWRHNVAPYGDEPRYESEVVPDSRLIGDASPLEHLRPGEGYEATLTILLRVHVSSVGIRVTGSTGGLEPEREVDARVGEAVQVRVEVENLGNTALTGAELWGLLPSDLEFVQGSARLEQGTGEPTPLADDVVRAAFYAPLSGTIPIGDLAVGARAVLSLEVRVLGDRGTTRPARAVIRVVPVGTYNNVLTIDVADA